ncbi:MAG: GNAT family N-acetyltransferase [Paracoccus sp. (in: a-proteobacteria)]|nr:GNAT family N-acetyltransferase [Paracoccus sp. (in: a-proteobacteria)]
MAPAELARLHAACFTLPRPWTEAEFAALIAAKGAFLLTHEGAGFLLGRAIASEAELLTLAVAPEARRGGIARGLLARFAAAARRAGAESAFLEVAADNAPALALYQSAGWREAGRRRGYYAPGLDAAIMRLDLSPPRN